MKFLLVNLLILSVLSLALCEDTTTTTIATTTTSNPTTTTTIVVTTTTITNQPTTSTLSTITTTTPQPTTTTTSTTSPDTTTTAPVPKKSILEFRVPKNLNETACLKVNMSADFNFTYEANIDGKSQNRTVLINLNNFTDYTGVCGNDSYNTLEIMFNKNWKLVFNYTLDKSTYMLSLVNLTYTIDADQFPNATDLTQKTATGYNLTEFSANRGNAYKCFSDTQIKLNDFATLDISNYIAQPFMTSNNQNLDTAIECPADTTGTSKLVPIIVGSALAILVVLVLVAYIIGRRKHKPGYQQV